MLCAAINNEWCMRQKSLYHLLFLIGIKTKYHFNVLCDQSDEQLTISTTLPLKNCVQGFMWSSMRFLPDISSCDDIA